MTKLSAPIDPWLAEFNRYSVPFGAFVPSASGKREDDQFVAAPSAAWERTFGGTAPSCDGKSAHSPGGGLRHSDLMEMRKISLKRAPIDALRRMPDASEAARPARAVSLSEPHLDLGAPPTSAGARAEPLGLPKATPAGGTSC